MCIDFQYAEGLPLRQLEKDKAQRKRAVRVLLAGVAAIPVIVLILGMAPFEVSMVFLLLFSMVFAVIDWQARLDDWIGGGSIHPELYEEYHLFPKKDIPVKFELVTVSETKFFDKKTVMTLSFLGATMLSFPLRYYQGKQAGIEDGRRELPRTVWHSISVYTPPSELPLKDMTVVRHGSGIRRVSFYTQGYVAGHNEVVREWIQSSSSRRKP